MKRMMLAALVCAVTMQVYGFLYAMDKECCEGGGKMCAEQPMEKMHEKHLDKLTKDLSLTPEQREKIAAIMKEKGEKKKAEMQKMRDSAKAEMEATQAGIKAVLTPEQAQKYDKIEADRKAKMEKRMEKKMGKKMKKGSHPMEAGE